MISLRGSIAARIVLGYGVMGIVSLIAVITVFYSGTVGMLDKKFDDKILAKSQRLALRIATETPEQLAEEVRRQLSDGIESDSEEYLLLDGKGVPLAGNVATWPQLKADAGRILSRDVLRNGAPSHARLLVEPIRRGGYLVIGYDLSERSAIRDFVWRSLAEGALFSTLLTLIGALMFRRQIERRIGDIRRTASDIGAGDLKRRVPVSGDDEFGLLNRDINNMLDRIGLLMEGVRNVSNAIAHDLRTPLTRIRGKLDEALRHDRSVPALHTAASGAIDDIDALIQLFERLLQIAEVESGLAIHPSDEIDLQRIIADMVEMFDATAELAQVRLLADPGPPLQVPADRNLIANAVASLIDNAIKHAGAGATVQVRTRITAEYAVITVRDDGPGIPDSEYSRVIQRFYRLDKSRAIPGNGLGLSIVDAIAKVHGGELRLADARPGLEASIRLPRAR